jgi:hypothetical protein
MTDRFRLPDGTYTSDVDSWSTEWDKLSKPFEALGFRMVAFDPGIVFCDARDEGLPACEMPLYVAKRIIEALGKAMAKNARTLVEKTLLPIEQTSWARNFAIEAPYSYEEAIRRASSPNFAVVIRHSNVLDKPMWVVEAKAEEGKPDDGGFWMEAFTTKYKALDFCEKMKWKVV